MQRTDNRGFADLEDSDVTRLLAVAAQSCRARMDAQALDRRLAFAAGLATVLYDPELGTVAAGSPAATAIATFLGRCRSVDDDWNWAVSQLGALGLEADLLLHQAASLVRPGLAGTYGVPMAIFMPKSTYVFVDVAKLPYGHNPYLCGYDKDGTIAAEAKRLVRRDRLLRGVGVKQAVPASVRAARTVQRRVERGELPPCAKHTLTPQQWHDVMSDARRILDEVDPWNIEGVRARLPETYSPDPYRALLRTLFTDPIRWDGKTGEVTSGQHRICGARVAGLDKVLISLG